MKIIWFRSLYIFLTFILFSLLPLQSLFCDVFTEPLSFYQPLIQRLTDDGFDPHFITKIFSDPRAEFKPVTLTLYLTAKEDPSRYEKFLKPESILQAKKFLYTNLKTLKKMEKRFQVDKEIVVAILLIESRFGENIGRHRVVPTLASLSLLNSYENLQKNYETLREYLPELSFEWLEAFANRRAQWAYQELKCFLRIIREESLDPLEVYGSYAGALGMAQFIPSSYINYALSSKGFEHWLLSKEDSINSIGNYLSAHGWKKRMSPETQKRILLTYNRSEPYVETILEISRRLKGRSAR
ncbi:MAG: lytic murein transglycosylase [Thermodesulfobacteriota bacterium]